MAQIPPPPHDYLKCELRPQPDEAAENNFFFFLFFFGGGGGVRGLLQVVRAGVHKTGIRGIQDTRQIVDGKTNDIENNDKKVGSKPLT